MKNESNEHRTLKSLLRKKLEEWTGSAITEYPSSGHELDVFSASFGGITMMVEIIWTHSKTNFYRDMMTMLSSDEQIKILVVNRRILENNNLNRIFQKARIKEIKRGSIVSQMIDGNRILESENFLNIDVKKQVLDLVNELRAATELQVEDLKRRILSETSPSALISDCIRLARKHNLVEMEKWLKYELYGYALSEEFNEKNQGRKIEDVVKELPNSPVYRILKPKLKIYSQDEYCELDYPLFWNKPISELEELNNDLQENGTSKICILKIPFDMFSPEAVKTFKANFPDLTSIPTQISRLEIANCLNGLKLKLHQFLDSI